MSEVFKLQDLLTITLETGYDLSVATVKKVMFKKPDGTEGEWTDNLTVSGTKLIYDVQEDDIDQIGKWWFRSYIEVSGEKAWGKKDYIKFLSSDL